MDFYKSSKAHLEQLRAQYPNHFSTTPNGGFAWPDGWHALVADACENVAFYSPSLRWIQIKEKFAELRMYYVDGPMLADDVSQMKTIIRIDGTFPDRSMVDPLIDLATRRSTETCMGCGRYGSRKLDNGYVLTACDYCFEQRER